MTRRLKILMVAAENDALPGFKVGGIGDVIRDVPPALVRAGCDVQVVTPAYGLLSGLQGVRKTGSVSVLFRARQQAVDVYEVGSSPTAGGVVHRLLESPELSRAGRGQIYCDDGPDAPFATDASRFALFCVAVAECIQQGHFGTIDVIHCHDWHATMLLVLRRYHPQYRKLQSIPCVFTIHNLALQGIRPLRGDDSSLAAWFPKLSVDRHVADTRWPNCINLMRAGIKLADKVHTVSPTYAREIQRPSAVAELGYYGGEGLEKDLQEVDAQGRLLGILNGCDYPQQFAPVRMRRPQLAQLLRRELWQWIGKDSSVASAHYVADQRIGQFRDRNKQILITSVGRVTGQKVRLLQQTLPDGRMVLDALLECLGKQGTYLFLGSGDGELEQFLLAASVRHENFIFLRGYSDTLAEALYGSGHLFLMPSSFEPCGISQMLAMRAGQPCLVHRVGGLNDTVQHEYNGFSFAGDTAEEQAQQLLANFKKALRCKQRNPETWNAVCRAAAESRFRWEDSVGHYLTDLYDT
jgi:starch synthase